MRENRDFFLGSLLVLVLFAIFGIVSAAYQPVPPPGEPPSAPSLPVLKVVYRTPEGDAKQGTAVSVAFDRPMVPVEAVGKESGTGPIAFSPSIEGTFVWLGQRLLAFHPKGELPIATTFTATVPAGIRALAGETLPQKCTWTFATPGLRVVRHRMGGGWLASTRPELLVRFNQPVDLKAVKECAVLQRIGGPENLSLDITRPDPAEAQTAADVQDTVRLRPTSDLPHGSKWQWVLLADLTGTSGPRPLGRRWSRSFTVCPTLAVKCADGFARPDGATGIRLQFTNRLDPQSVSKKRLTYTIAPGVKVHSSYQDYDGYVFEGGFETEREYRITLTSTIRDRFGNEVKGPLTFRVKIPDYEPTITLGGHRGYIERIGPREFAMAVVNLPVVAVELLKIGEQDVVPYLMEERRDGERAWPEGHSRRGVFHRLMGTTEKEKFKRVVVPLKWVLQENEGGFVFLRTKAKVREENAGDDEFVTQEAILQVTDIGITAKASPENTLIWATSLYTGEPLPGVSVCMRDDKNKVIWRDVTNGSGYAVGPGIDTTWEAKPVFLIAKNDRDLAYLPLDREQIGLWQFNVSRDWNPTRHRTIAHIFTDRGLYKAGETVHAKGIVRVDTEKGIAVPSKKTVQVTATDPRGKKLFTRTLPLSRFGTFHVDVALKKNSSLGHYWLRACLPDHPESDSESGSFQVAAFRPAEFEVEVRPERKEYLCGDAFRAFVKAKYLFGAPMRKARIDWSAYWDSTWFCPKDCDDYRFGDVAGYHSYRGRVDREIESGEGTLGEDGGATIDVPLAPKDRIACALRCNLSVTATDASHQTVTGRASAVVHPADVYVGIKRHSYILTAKKPTRFHFIAVKPDGTPVDGARIKVNVIRRRWHTVRKRSVWSRYHYDSEPVDDTVASTTLRTGARGVSWRFVPPSSGSFFLEASAMDAKDRIARTVTHFYATGDEYAAWHRDDKNTVQLAADKDEYAVGETARILIKSPYRKAKAILTIERQGVMEQRVLDLASTTPTVEIPITKEHMPNVFASVVLVQGRTSDKFSKSGADLGKPSYKAGYINLPVRNDAARLAVEVKPDQETAQPGDTITVSVRVKDKDGKPQKAEVALIAADEGVLKLIGYRTPDPVAAIFRPRPLAVETCETRRSVIGRTRFDWLGRKGTAAGDKGRGPGLITGVDLFRKRFFYTAYFNPSLLTDENGRASVSFELPDNLTRFRLMAVAVGAGNLLGSGESDVEVKKPILIRPALPRFANSGDKFVARALVHNYTDTKQSITTTLTTKGQVAQTGDPTRALDLAPNEEKAIEFPVEAGDPGKATFQFSAQAGKLSDGVEIGIPVHYPATYLTTLKEGETEAPVSEPIRPPEACRQDVGEVEVTLSASRLSELGEGLSYLLKYPYGCIEQTSSPMLVLAALKELLPAIASSGITAAQVDVRVEHGIHRILSMQRYDGGFGYWPNSTDSQPWSSSYGTFALLACKRAKYDVPKAEFDRALSYLSDFLRTNVERNRYGDWATRCMMVYTLACAGKPEHAYHDLLARRADTLPVFAKAFLAMAIHKGKLQAGLLPPLQASLNEYVDGKVAVALGPEEEEQLARIMDSNARTDAIVLSALLEIEPGSKRIGVLVDRLMRRRKNGRWRSTQENAYCLLALADYVAGREGAPPDFVASVTLGERLMGMKRFASKGASAFGVSIPLADVVQAGSVVAIGKEGPGKLFYTVKTRFLPLQTDRPPVDKGFRVVRRYEPYKGGAAALQEYAPRDLVKVHLTVSTPVPRYYVAVEDPLPAGLEAVNTQFVTTAPELRRFGRSFFHYCEKHDDRVLLFADWLPAGTHEHVYVAQATTPGTFAAPAAHAEEMYAPEHFGESESSRVVIKAEKE